LGALARSARDRARRLSNRAAAALSFLLGVVVFVIGAALIEGKGSSLEGSPPGWILVTAGICLVLAAVGIYAGAYGE
jgi:hypothetical protein